MTAWFKKYPDRLCLPLAVIVAVVAIIVLPSCGIDTPEVKAQKASATNEEAIKRPTFVGCLPDGRALFRLDFMAPDNQFEDRVYITLDGQATAASMRRFGKQHFTESVAWPIPTNVKPELLDPCTKEVASE